MSSGRFAPGHQDAKLFGPAWPFLLRTTLQRQGTGADVFRDDAAGADISARPDFDRRHKRRVRTDEGSLADLGPFLIEPVIIAEDRAGADIGASADAAVPEIGEMIGLRAVCRG